MSTFQFEQKNQNNSTDLLITTYAAEMIRLENKQSQ